MSSILYGHDVDVAHWVAERIPHMRSRIPYFERGMVFGSPAAMGVLDKEGRMIAGAVFHNYDPFVGNIEVSCAAESPRWGNRETFRELLRYPFTQLSCLRCSAVTPRSGTSTRRFLEGLGFRREGSARLGFGTENAIIYGLLAEEWDQGRFCAPRQRNAGVARGQKRAKSSASA